MVARHHSDLLWPRIDDIPNLSTHQSDTVAVALSERLGILTGSPGTGKTFTTAAIIKAICDQHGAHNVAVCAPTGKAAVRLTSNLSEYQIPVSAQTIHRLLGVQRAGHDGKGWGFQCNSKNRLPFKFIFCDEFSMGGADITAAFFLAIKPGSHVLLIGDDGQLPPVEHGAPLRDLMAAGIPTGKLSEIRRNSGLIVRACKAIRDGQPFETCDRIDLAAGQNLRHVEQLQPAHALAALERIIANAPAEFDKIWDIQPLVALNAKSEVGRANINSRLQGMLNPEGALTANGKFRLGDKVICTSNSLMELVPGADLDSSDQAGEPVDFSDPEFDSPIASQPSRAMPGRVFVANGDIGKVVYVEGKEMHVRFDFPRRTVRVFMGAKKSGRKSGSDDQKAGEESSQTGCDLDLAYAITVHKSQGSQNKIIIPMADGSFGANMICSREWWYTAYSRAELAAISIGQRQVINGHCRRVALGVRKTFLKEKLKELVTA
jgi:exodeoxyribonuclease V alpha subunit